MSQKIAIIAILLVFTPVFAGAQTDGAALEPSGAGTAPGSASVPTEIVQSRATVTQSQVSAPAVTQNGTSRPATVTATATPPSADAIATNTPTTSPILPVDPMPALPISNTAAIVAAVGGLLFAGLVAAKALQKNKDKSKSGDRCEPIKKQLEQKKRELTMAENEFSLQQTLINTLKGQIGKKKDQVVERLKEKAQDTILKDTDEGAIGKTIKTAAEAKGKYDDVQKKYEDAKKLLEALKAKRQGLQEEVVRLEAAYKVCVAGAKDISVNVKKTGPVAAQIPVPAKNKLFVDRAVEIDAPASKVWETLTEREFTDQWTHEFSSGGPQFHIESSWKLGAPVLWKSAKGKVVVEGVVTALKPFSLLRFTVFDVREEDRPKISDTDGITYLLMERAKKTKLRVLQGDFAVMDEGEKYHKLTDAVWLRVLPIIKRLSEEEREAA